MKQKGFSFDIRHALFLSSPASLDSFQYPLEG